ncbi:uncharacterized protein Z519_08822 [Cladophialophora bantiana CBS 173.52]|uniref:Pyrroline-5-carboxylate reductase dimerisation domain-containing protein n=1 Tax=Cladophialophora bantiana (strain ATCC 10958 / CBS 173.52 / CDC B-1940 / NIH 8579) TaxID=1442370 RepID=A0A0D2HZY9_CLAB1|nr:uncharacterized protein Z519_08822 [Cladophialophora bantiana CBS 173.52]KIW90179.1 hypothetical protein Z519_08822 [Cladophialophora bantiana CBS 173.52]
MALGVATQWLRTASTLLRDKMTIESLKETISVAKGITINALLQLDRGKVRSGISDAVRHVVRYSKEMADATNLDSLFTASDGSSYGLRGSSKHTPSAIPAFGAVKIAAAQLVLAMPALVAVSADATNF